MPRSKVLIVGPAGAEQSALRRTVVDAACDVVCMEAPHEALERDGGCGWILLDVASLVDPLGAIRALANVAPVMVVDEPRPAAVIVAMLRAGAREVFTRPLRAADVERAQASEGHPALLGDSEAMQAAIEAVSAQARGGAPIALVGEASTGMESLARLAHGASEHARGAFVTFAGARETMTAEDALAAALTEARDGSLFVEGLDALAPPVIAMLTRARSSARLIASCASRDALPADLAPRAVAVPPLRERPEDLATIAPYVASVIARRHDKTFTLASKTLRTLQAHRWAGNLAELRSMLEALVLAPPVSDARPSGEYRVPVRRDAVTLILADGTRREGTVFRAGDEAIEALLEKPEPFLPIDTGGVRLYARRAIACLSAKSHASAGSPLEVRVRVAVRLRCGARIEGELRYDAHRGSARAIDHLNGSAPTFTVHEGDDVHCVAKEHVEHVEEAR